MNNPNKILATIIAILLFLVIVLGYLYYDRPVEIASEEYVEIAKHESKINAFQDSILALRKNVVTLQAERDALKKQKEKIRYVTIHEVDSITRLPFSERLNYSAREISRIDSIRRRYVRDIQ